MQRRGGRSAAFPVARLLAALLATALLAVGCGGSDGESGGGDGPGEGTTGEGAEDPEGGDDGEPTPGGSVVIGIEAEVDGFDPTRNRFPVAGLTYANAVFDPLAVFDPDGEAVPYLAESIEPNEDHTVWTIRVRPGVQFHDGSPLDAVAVKRNLDGQKASPLTGPALGPIEGVTVVDDRTVEIQMNQPWVPFPAYLTTQLGFVAAPSMLDAEDGPRNPVGTGPFVFEEWVPGQRFRATRNEAYWRAAEGLPYLDAVEIRPIVDFQTRENSLLSGDLDLIHTTDTQTIVNLRGDDEVELVELDEGETEENFALLNTAVPPFDNVLARRALVLATDQQRVIDTIYNGILEPATGPFEGGRFESDTGYPGPDPDAARQAVAAYEQEAGDDLSFTFGTTNSGRNLQVAQLLQSMWGEAGIDVEIEQVEQSQFILNALLGDYQAYLWRQHGSPDPDGEYVWWSETTSAPPGELSLNLSRNSSPEVQSALEEGRANPDPDVRAEAYRRVAAAFAEQLPFVYTSRTLWAYAFAPEIRGVTGTPLPGGGGGAGGDPLPGVIRTVGLWVEQ